MRNLLFKLASSLLAALLLTTAIQPIVPARAAGILYAAPGGLTSGSCNSWANACELRYALNIAVSGDEIWVRAGTYKPTNDTNRSMSFQLKSGVAIYGGFAGTETARAERNPADHVSILSGDIGVQGETYDNSCHVVLGADNAILDGVTVTKGHAFGGLCSRSGGGMYNNFVDPIVTNVIFSDNYALERGGGMYNDSSRAILSNLTFQGNSAGLRGEPIIGLGGGLAISYSGLGTCSSLTNVTFQGNSADQGGGLAVFYCNSATTLMNVSFSANSATSVGGGLYNHRGIPTLTNVILWNDSAGTSSPEIYNTTAGSIPTISYSVVEGSGGSSSWDSALGSDGGGNLDADPLLGVLQNNGGFTETMALASGSSAVDTGNNTGCPATDQRYVARDDGSCDIGAYELLDIIPPALDSFTRQTPSGSPTNADSLVFRAAFSEPVKNVSSGDFTVSGTTASVTGVSAVNSSTYDITVSGGDLANYNGIVGLNLAGGQDITDLRGNALPGGEPATDETYELDNSAPTATITSGPSDPTNSTSADFTFTTAGSPANIECDLDSGGFAACDSSTMQQYAGPLAEGSHTFTVRVTDAVGNSSTDDYTWEIDLSNPTVTITNGPDSPTNSTSAYFEYKSAGSPASFECDLDSGGFVACDSDTHHEYAPGSLVEGTHIFTVRVTDSAGNSGSDNYIWSIDTTDINVLPGGVVGYPGGQTIQDGGTVAGNFTTILVSFDSDANNPAGNSDRYDVTNPYNYLLLQTGPDGVYDTDSCLAFLINGYTPLDDDIAIPTGPVAFDNHGGSGPFQASVTVNNGNPLPTGEYRLHICGSTSITDLYGNVLNNGTDVIRNFQTRNIPAAAPKTGFAPNRVTARPPQTVPYGSLGDLWLEIPSLGIREPIVGVPVENGIWDVSWLDGEIGWLAGSAFPTWVGNSALTGHVYDAFGRPGPFVDIEGLRYGAQIIVHAWDGQYIYEVQKVTQILPDNTAAILEHEDLPWLTLVTCRGYDEISDSYAYRVLVRAVLVRVQAE